MKKITFIIALFFLFSSVLSFAAGLSNRKASDYTKRLYKYLSDIYGKQVITGQMENAWNDSCNMLDRVYKDTAKYPALMGFDFMNYTGMGYKATNVQTDRAIWFWNGRDFNMQKISDKHGIVSFMWHWRDPAAKAGQTGSFSASETGFRIPYDTVADMWKTESEEYKAIIKDLDVIAAELQKLQKHNIPVLWRPMHEAAGNLAAGWPGACAWFWWGAGNKSVKKADGTYTVSTNLDECAECYVALWRLMYDYFTNEKGLQNLIWVWNGQNTKFYPGSQYVDIIGNDIYASAGDFSSQKKAYDKFAAMDKTKLTALTECGIIPDMEKVAKDKAWWLFFMVWNDGAINANGNVSTDSDKNNFWSGEYSNPKNHKEAVYNSKIAITLDELPDLTKY